RLGARVPAEVDAEADWYGGIRSPGLVVRVGPRRRAPVQRGAVRRGRLAGRKTDDQRRSSQNRSESGHVPSSPLSPSACRSLPAPVVFTPYGEPGEGPVYRSANENCQRLREVEIERVEQGGGGIRRMHRDV